MKTYKILLLLTMALSVITTQAQTQDMKYRRSSLQLLVFEQDMKGEYEMKPQEQRLVQECENEFAWELHQNFNDHTCVPMYVDCYDRTSEERDYYGRTTTASYKIKIVFSPGGGSMGIGLDQYFKNEHVAEKLIAKWFNQSSDKVNGSYYNMDLIQERGAYDASQLDRLRSHESIRGENILKDAGMDLIPNTFVVCVRLSFRTRQDIVNKLVGHSPRAGDVYKTTHHIVHKVYAETYLYKLEWTEKESNLFMSKYYYSDPKQLLSSKEFNLKLVDEYTNSEEFWSAPVGKSDASLRAVGKSDDFRERSDALLKRAIYNVLHDNMVELQARNEGFGIKAPLIDVDTKKKYATAFIGKKEGLGNRDQFEVLMPKYDEKNNVFRYVSVGVLEVDPKRIWDNTNNNSNQEIDRTYFKGVNKKMAPGMILNQIAFTQKTSKYHAPIR